MSKEDRERNKGKVSSLHVVFKSGACHRFEIDTQELAQSTIKAFMDGATGRFAADPDTIINFADVSAVSLGDRCQ